MKKRMCLLLILNIIVSLFPVVVSAQNVNEYLKSVNVDYSNNTIEVICQFPAGEENRMATIVLANKEITGELDLGDGSIENVMIAPVEYDGTMSKELGFGDTSGDYMLYVYCGEDRIEYKIKPPHLAMFNLSDTYDAINGTTRERFEQRISKLPDEINIIEPIADENSNIWFVSQSGNDFDEGTEAKPYKTIGKALQALADSNSSGTIILRGGKYNISEIININATHTMGDTASFIKAFSGERVVFTKGTELKFDDFQIADEDIRKSIIDEAARNKVMQVDLSQKGIENISDVKLYINDNEVLKSRWPNNSEVRMGTITYQNNTSEDWTTKYMSLNKDRLNLWDFTSRSIYFEGALSKAWEIDTHKIKAYNKETGEVTTGRSWAGASVSDPTITHFYSNVLEEIDVPGEWCIDDEMLYIYPPQNFYKSDIRIVNENSSDKIVEVSGASKLVFDGIDFENTNRAVCVENSDNVIFQNCTFKNISDVAAVFKECTRSGIVNSEINNVGNIGVNFCLYTEDHNGYSDVLNNEGVNNLLPTRNFVQNCSFNNIEYAAVADYYGIGDIVSHNLIGNMKNNGIRLYNTMESIVEYNEIFSFAEKISDSGAIYGEGIPLFRGNVVRYNYLHSPIAGGKGVYFDNMSSGNIIYGNIMRDCLYGTTINGGRDNTIFNNIIINDDDRFGDAAKALRITGDYYYNHEAVDPFFNNTFVSNIAQFTESQIFNSEMFRNRYPELYTLSEDVKAYVSESSVGSYVRGSLDDLTDTQNIARAASGNYVCENVLAGGYNGNEIQARVTMWGVEGYTDTDTNLTYQDVSGIGFVDYEGGNLELNTGAALFQSVPDFEYPDFDRVGPISKTMAMTGGEIYGAGYNTADKLATVSWSNVNGAREYNVTIATDENFDEIVYEETTNANQCSFTSELSEDIYYVKVICETTAKSYLQDNYEISGSFKLIYEDLEYVEKTAENDVARFVLKNNTAADIIADIYVAQFVGNELKKVEVYQNETISSGKIITKSVLGYGNNKVKAFVWSSEYEAIIKSESLN